MRPLPPTRSFAITLDLPLLRRAYPFLVAFLTTLFLAVATIPGARAIEPFPKGMRG